MKIDNPRFGIHIEPMDEARPRFVRDLSDARARAEMLQGQNEDDAAHGEQIHPSLLAAEDNAFAKLSRLNRFQDRGQVPVLIDVFVFGRRLPLPHEIGRPSRLGKSAVFPK